MTPEQRAAKIMTAIRQNAPLETIEKYIITAIKKAVDDAKYKRDYSWTKTKNSEGQR